MVVLGAAGVMARRAGRASAPILAALAGLSFAVVAVAAPQPDVPTPWWHGLADPALWAILAQGGLGLLFFTTALQRGSVTTATALTFAVDTVVPAAIGLAFLGDTTRPGYGLARQRGSS